MIAIFKNEQDAIDFSNEVHEYLTENRTGYNAERWCYPNKALSEDLWAVSIPKDYHNLKGEIRMSLAIAQTIKFTDKLPDTWGDELYDFDNKIVSIKEKIISIFHYITFNLFK